MWEVGDSVNLVPIWPAPFQWLKLSVWYGKRYEDKVKLHGQSSSYSAWHLADAPPRVTAVVNTNKLRACQSGVSVQSAPLWLNRSSNPYRPWLEADILVLRYLTGHGDTHNKLTKSQLLFLGWSEVMLGWCTALQSPTVTVLGKHRSIKNSSSTRDAVNNQEIRKGKDKAFGTETDLTSQVKPFLGTGRRWVDKGTLTTGYILKAYLVYLNKGSAPRAFRASFLTSPAHRLHMPGELISSSKLEAVEFLLTAVRATKYTKEEKGQLQQAS